MSVNFNKILLVTTLFLALMVNLPKAQAENWIELFPGANMNSDYVFVDRTTGFVVVEVYFETDQGGDTDLMAVDCDNWRAYVLSLNPGTGNRLIYPDWQTDMSSQTGISEGSPFQVLADTVCPNRHLMTVADLLN
ncbi:MAG: hypothetical protein ACTSU8_01760 [Alphaproteobacteria bacterium]